MKIAHTYIVLSVLLGGVGCTQLQPFILRDPVGPLQPLPDESSPRGSLIVYSDTEGPVYDPTDYSPHRAYKLYSMEGHLLQSVENRDAMSARKPVTLKLAVGQYKVTATAPRVGLVSVPVVIREGRITVIDLNGEVLPHTLAASERWVELPNGQVIGSKAE